LQFEWLNTLREDWLRTYNISPFGGDKREGAGVENYFFNILLSFLAELAMQARGQPGNFAARCITMHRAAGDRPVQHRGGLLQGFSRFGFIARSDCLGRGFGECASASLYDPIALCAFKALPMTLLGRRMNWNMRHNQLFVTVRMRQGNTLCALG
jgi:hypothetical protein